VSALQWVDVHSYLADDILPKVDRMSMLSSLETRAPLLDHHLAEFCFGLPSGAFHDGQRGKLLFRDVARRLVPPELLVLPKRGFTIPVGHWLRGPLAGVLRDALDGLGRRGPLQAGALERVAREHADGLADHGQRLWALLMLELWARQFLDRSRPPLAPPDARRHVAGRPAG
jgi:asparagine synthase (glutamine-hydrolysing)